VTARGINAFPGMVGGTLAELRHPAARADNPIATPLAVVIRARSRI